MIRPVRGRRGICQWRTALIALALALTPHHASAEPCDFIDPGTLTCGLAPAETLHQGRVDRTLATDPTFARSKSRLTDKAPPKPSGDTAIAPFALTPDGDDKANFKTSLSLFSTALGFADWRRIEDAKTDLGGDRTLPKPIACPNPDFDIWAEGRSETIRAASPADRRSTNVTTYMGADYRLSSQLLFGAMVQIDDARQSVVSTRSGANGGAYLAGPYLAYELSPNVTVGTNFAWGSATDSASLDASQVRFNTDRSLTQTHITGHWGFGKWQLMQSAAVSYVDESAATSRPGIGGADVEMTRLLVGPELKRRIDTGRGSSLEPFAFLKSSLDLDAAMAEPSTMRNSVGGGVVVHRPAGYRIEARGDYSEAIAAESLDESMSGKVMVFVPLP
jgi:hypothetical protein